MRRVDIRVASCKSSKSFRLCLINSVSWFSHPSLFAVVSIIHGTEREHIMKAGRTAERNREDVHILSGLNFNIWSINTGSLDTFTWCNTGLCVIWLNGLMTALGEQKKLPEQTFPMSWDPCMLDMLHPHRHTSASSQLYPYVLFLWRNALCFLQSFFIGISIFCSGREAFGNKMNKMNKVVWRSLSHHVRLDDHLHVLWCTMVYTFLWK